MIPAHDEEGCIASTAEHLHVELRLHNVPHEIVVVDDGSTDKTWETLQEAQKRVPTLVPVRNPGPHGFGRALVYGFADYPTTGQPTSLLVTRDGAQRTVRSFNCPAWGHKFVYKPFTRAERDLLASGERAETIAVRMASN